MNTIFKKSFLTSHIKYSIIDLVALQIKIQFFVISVRRLVTIDLASFHVCSSHYKSRSSSSNFIDKYCRYTRLPVLVRNLVTLGKNSIVFKYILPICLFFFCHLFPTVCDVLSFLLCSGLYLCIIFVVHLMTTYHQSAHNKSNTS